jgi:hypothetical protein
VGVDTQNTTGTIALAVIVVFVGIELDVVQVIGPTNINIGNTDVGRK